MYIIPQLGRPKGRSIAGYYSARSIHMLEYESVCVKVTPENVKQLFEMYPIVCEAFDKPDQKAMLVRELLGQCPETMVVSGNGMAGLGDTNDITDKEDDATALCMRGSENRCRKWDRPYSAQSSSLRCPSGQ